MKRLLYGTLAALLLVLCFTVSALAETQAVLHDDLEYEKGKLIVAWDVTGDEADRYIVTVQPILSGTTNQLIITIGATRKHSIATVECVPGRCYVIELQDGIGRLLNRKAYQMEPVNFFQDGKLTGDSVKVFTELRKQSANGEITPVGEFWADEIMTAIDDGSAAYGIKYEMQMPQLAKARTYFLTLMFEAPDGFVYVEQATDVTFANSDSPSQTQFFEMAGSDFFRKIYGAEGEIPRGEYAIVLLWDGMWVKTVNFTVK